MTLGIHILPRVIGDDRVSKAGLAKSTGIQILSACTDARLCASTQFLVLQDTSMSSIPQQFVHA